MTSPPTPPTPPAGDAGSPRPDRRRARGPGSGTPRRASEVGNLVRGFVVLGVVVLAFAGLLRACTFAPGAPGIERSTLPKVEAGERLRAAASGVPFAVRVPTVPGDWIAQSFDVRPIGVVPPAVAGPSTPRAVRVGWVTPDDSFVRLVQSSGDEEAVVTSEGGGPVATGAVQAAGRTWVVHRGVRGEELWVADVDGARLLVTGSASPDRFTQLAEAALAGPVVGR